MPTPSLNGDLEPLLGLREPVSGLMHMIAALVAAFGTGVLIARSAGAPRRRLAFGIYGTSLVALFTASAAYHLVTLPPEALVYFRKVDHASIFVLIAGTFTPFYALLLNGWWGRANLTLIWVIALCGIAAKVAFIEMPDAWSSGLYVGMGWLALICYGEIAAGLSRGAVAGIFAGGVIYTIGGIVDAVRWPVPWPGYFGFHEVLHLLVVIAAAIHFHVILAHIAPLDAHPATA